MNDDPRPSPESAAGPTSITHKYEPPVRAFWRFLMAAIYAVGVNWFTANLAFSVAGRHPILADLVYRLSACLMILAGFSFMLRVFDQVERNPLVAMGLPGGTIAVRDTLVGIAIGSAMIVTAVGAVAVFGRLTFGATVSAVTLRQACEVALLFIFGALLEELTFRGYPFQRLVESIGPVGAILLFSVLFGWAHLGNPNAGGIRSWGFFNTIAVGMLFAVAYLRSHALWLPIGMHFAWNFVLGVVFGLPVSGIRDFSVLVRGSASGPHLLTGGSYGIEASLTGAVVIVLGFVPVLWLTRGRQYRNSAPHEVPSGI